MIWPLKMEIRDSGGKLYLTRWVLWAWGPRIFLHRIWRKDHDRDPHNHPWPFGLSLILRGGYEELRVRPKYAGQSAEDLPLGSLPDHTSDKWLFQAVSWWNWLGPNTYHRITHVRPNTWTLFLAGPRTREWGFWTEAGHEDRRTYLELPGETDLND